MSKLTASDRKEYKKLMETKQQNLLDALNGELFRNKDDLKREALYSQGYQLDSEELQNKIDTIDREIQDVISEFLPMKEAQIEIEINIACEEIDRRLLEEKSLYAQKVSALNEEKREVRQRLLGDHASLTHKIGEEKVPDKIIEKKSLQDIWDKVHAIECSVEIEINRKISMVQKMKYRIRSAINDKMNELYEALINAEEREDAKALLQQVPTISELINSCENTERLASLVQKLSPSLALPAPKPTPQEKPADTTQTSEIQGEARIVEEAVQATN